METSCAQTNEPEGARTITEPRINDRVRVPEVRLVGPNGEQVGIVKIDVALRLAQEAELDLVEVAPDARPPVAKLMDYGKFKYESAQKARDARRNQGGTVLKEIRFRLKIDPHDYGTKRGHVERFLRQGDKVKVMIMFRGREQSRPAAGVRLLGRLAEDIAELGTVESSPRQDGRNMTMVIAPLKRKATEPKPSAAGKRRQSTSQAQRAASDSAEAPAQTQTPGSSAEVLASAPVAEPTQTPDARPVSTAPTATEEAASAPASVSTAGATPARQPEADGPASPSEVASEPVVASNLVEEGLPSEPEAASQPAEPAPATRRPAAAKAAAEAKPSSAAKTSAPARKPAAAPKAASTKVAGAKPAAAKAAPRPASPPKAAPAPHPAAAPKPAAPKAPVPGPVAAPPRSPGAVPKPAPRPGPKKTIPAKKGDSASNAE